MGPADFVGQLFEYLRQQMPAQAEQLSAAEASWRATPAAANGFIVGTAYDARGLLLVTRDNAMLPLVDHQLAGRPVVDGGWSPVTPSDGRDGQMEPSYSVPVTTHKR